MTNDKLIEQIETADEDGNWVPGRDVSPLECMAEKLANRILADAEALKAADELADRIQKAQAGWPHRQGWIEEALTAYNAKRGERAEATCDEIVKMLWKRMAEGEQRITSTEATVYQKLRATLAQIDAEPAEPSQPTVQEAARTLLKAIPYNEDAIEAVQTKTRPTDFIASLRALAEGDSQ